jgi:hypothetical protein
MSRSGYTDECENTWDMIRWQGARKSAIRRETPEQRWQRVRQWAERQLLKPQQEAA